MAKGNNPGYRGAPPAAVPEAPAPEVAALGADAGAGAPPPEAAEPVGESWAESVPTEAEQLAAREAALLEGLSGLRTDMGNVHSELEAIARAAAKTLDHAKHAKFATLANAVAEFRNGLAL